MSERRAHKEPERSSRATGHRASRLPRRKQALPIHEACAGLHARSVSVEVEDVVFVKGLIEASDGLAAVFAERGGELVIAAPVERRAELSELLDDLARDIGAKLSPDAAPTAPTDLRHDNG